MSRHTGVENALRWLKPNPNLPEHLQHVADHCFELGVTAINEIPVDSPELTEGLRKLLEAKDCFVRAAIIAKEAQ